MHGCFAGLPFPPRAAALIAPRMTLPLPSARHSRLPTRFLPNRGFSHPLDPKPRSLPEPRVRLLPRRAGAAVQKLMSPGRWSLPNHGRLEPFSILPPITQSCTAEDGSSRPPHLFKRTSVQYLGVFPSNTPFPRLRIKPLSKSSPPPGTVPPGRFTCSKELVYSPQTPSPNHGLSWPPDRVWYSLPRHVERFLQVRHDSSRKPRSPLKDTRAARATHERSFRPSSRSRSR
jgi:hypothetical protein